MGPTRTTAVVPGKPRNGSIQPDTEKAPESPRFRRRKGGFLTQYKPEQGQMTRRGTFIGACALIAWGAWFTLDRLRIYEGDEWWRLLITQGIPLVLLVVVGTIAWRIAFVNRGSCDFMIATEGEMKKVSWSTKREVIGSTKVVIMFTVLMAAFLFLVDLVFQQLFQWVGVLKVL
jgi:preprotein translocase subunit SecE